MMDHPGFETNGQSQPKSKTESINSSKNGDLSLQKKI